MVIQVHRSPPHLVPGSPKHSWRHVDPATARYLHFLTDAGYTPSAVERLAIGHQPPAGEVG